MWIRQHIFLDFKTANNKLLCSHTYVPTACFLYGKIRIFLSVWDKEKRGRVFFVDVDRNDPMRVLSYSKRPVLDLGELGRFDEHGVTPMSVVLYENHLRLYYAGWQHCSKYRYKLFTGLAISNDEGDSFQRYQKKPVIAATPQFQQVRTGGCIIYDNEIWKTWYAEAYDTIIINDKKVPKYNLSYMESKDGINWPKKGRIIKNTKRGEVFGYGRSAVIKRNRKYHAWISVRTFNGYRIAYCHSTNGIEWSDFDFKNKGLEPNKRSNFDDIEVSFPSILVNQDKTYMFYNGNNFGADGIMVATANTKELFDE